jgi:hypothetical protein
MKKLLLLFVFALFMGIPIVPCLTADAKASSFHALSNLSNAEETLPQMSDEQLATIEGEGTFICIGCNIAIVMQININVQIGTGKYLSFVSNQSNGAFIRQRFSRFFQ